MPAVIISRRSPRSIQHPDTAAFTSVLLAALTCLLGVYTPFNYESAPAINLPFTRNQSSSCYLFDGPGMIISADANRRIYFAHGNRAIQSEVIRRVAARHRVPLPDLLLSEVAKLPFVGLDAQYLPTYLALAPQERHQLHLLGISNNQLHDELADYVSVARTVTLEQTGYNAYAILKLDKDLPAGDVKRIVRTLQQQGIRSPLVVANSKAP
jgi:biopolymer transport protein ExbD